MKLMPAVFAAVALTAVAGAAQADVGPDEVIRLYKSQALGDFEQFNNRPLPSTRASRSAIPNWTRTAPAA